jgi:poly-gamma-glutamate synthesis protein (capsule biosynthesis protein)
MLLCAGGISAQAQKTDSAASLQFIAIGDINLGRALGKELLKGRVDYPFDSVRAFLKTGDLVFGNLESPISDQHGETVNPTSNVIFCAPPIAATSLKDANIAIVSTANNHASDYGKTGIRETIRSLDQAGVRHVGTADSGKYTPTILIRNGIRIGFLAYTQFVNIAGDWNEFISVFDSLHVATEIRTLKPFVDMVVVSFHGGTEYAAGPNETTRRQLHWIAESGADIVLGHHPHVPQGIVHDGSCWIFNSLGNVVFYQPQQRQALSSFVATMIIQKQYGVTSVSDIRLFPIQVGYQPTLTIPRSEARNIMKRISKYSNVKIHETTRGYVIEQSTAPSVQ